MADLDWLNIEKALAEIPERGIDEKETEVYISSLKSCLKELIYSKDRIDLLEEVRRALASWRQRRSNVLERWEVVVALGFAVGSFVLQIASQIGQNQSILFDNNLRIVEKIIQFSMTFPLQMAALILAFLAVVCLIAACAGYLSNLSKNR